MDYYTYLNIKILILIIFEIISIFSWLNDKRNDAY